MKKAIFTLICSFVLISTVKAQQKDFEWRLGVSGGYTNYYGDLSPYTVRGFADWDAIKNILYFNENYFDRYSFKISLEKQLSPTIGLMFNYGQYQFSMSDRYIRRDGSLYMDNPNFERALNFENETRDVGLAFVFKTDNDIILPSKSFLAPYLTVGFGLINFEVKGDLLDSQGNRYNYSSGNVQNDGVFETDLSSLNTELENGYDLGAFYTNFGLGIRFRLGSRLEIFAQSDFMYTFTDYLDDVSGEYRDSYENSFQAYAAQPGTNTVSPDNSYRGDPNDRNDIIIYHGIGLKFNFGASKKTFSGPRLSTFYPDYGSTQSRQNAVPEQDQEDRVSEDTVAARPAPTGNTYNYFLNEGNASRQIDRLDNKVQLMEWDQEIQKRENQIQAATSKEKSLIEINQKFDSQYKNLQSDTLLSQSRKDSLLELTTQNRFNVRYSLDSIDRRRSELRSEIDSISRLKSNFNVRPNSREDAFEQDSLSMREMSGDSIPQPKGNFQGDSLSKRYPYSRPVVPKNQNTENDSQVMNTTSGAASTQQSASMQQRLSQLEAENQNLRRSQDSVSSLPRERIYLRPYYDPYGQQQYQAGQQNNEPNSQNQNENLRQTETQEEESEDRQRRRWRPFAGLFGGNDQQSRKTSPARRPVAIYPGSVSRPVNPPTIEDEGQEKPDVNTEKMALGVNNTLLGTQVATPDQQKVAETMEKEESEIPERTLENVAPEVIRDTVYVEKESDIRLLDSKEEIFFEVNQPFPDREEINKLAPLVDFVKDNENYVLSLVGYSDNTGNVSYNLRLIQNRIESVAKILREQFGLEDNQIRTESGGQVVRGPNRSANVNDRKVEVRIMAQN